MGIFAYRTLSGEPGSTIEAPDRASAVRELLRRGVTPVSIEAVDERSGGFFAEPAAPAGGAAPSAAGSGLFSRSSMSRAEMASFVRELATALSAGLPLVQALRTLAKQGRGEGQRRMLSAIIDGVEHGRSLGDAVEAWGKPFNEMTINLVRAGESSGRLSEVLTQAADLLDRDLKLRRSLLAATLYPMILGGLIAIAVIIVVTVIVPRIVKPLQSQMAQLPWPTRVVQDVAAFFGGYWWAIIPATLAGLYGLSRLYANPEARLWIDTKLLRVPILGRMLRDVAVARFTRTLGTLTSAGVPVLQALRLTKGTLGNTAMERVIESVVEEVAGGRTLAEPMERSGYFPPMLVQIVNLGERSGRLDELLGQAAKAFEERTETSVKLFTTALPPLLVVLLACVVGFVVMAILLPLLQFQEALR